MAMYTTIDTVHIPLWMPILNNLMRNIIWRTKCVEYIEMYEWNNEDVIGVCMQVNS